MTQLAKNVFFPMIYHVYNETDTCFTKKNIHAHTLYNKPPLRDDINFNTV